MCDSGQSMDKLDQLEDRLDRLESTLNAVLDNMKMTVKYTPESYELVKTEDMPGLIPTMKVR